MDFSIFDGFWVFRFGVWKSNLEIYLCVAILANFQGNFKISNFLEFGFSNELKLDFIQLKSLKTTDLSFLELIHINVLHCLLKIFLEY